MTVPESPEEGRLALRLEELALNGAAVEALLSPRSFSWLGDHQDEAAELAALLHEAAPKLAFANLRAPHPSGSGRSHLPKNRSYEVSDLVKDRLRAAVPMDTGPGNVPWSRLTAIISSEMLREFDEGSDAALLARLASLGAASAGAGTPQSPAGSPLLSPRDVSPRERSPRGGEMLEINSGGRVIFCLFAPLGPPAPTPPCSLRCSPEKEGSGYINMAAQLPASQFAGDVRGNGKAGGAGSDAVARGAQAAAGASSSAAADGEQTSAFQAAANEGTLAEEDSLPPPGAFYGDSLSLSVPSPAARTGGSQSSLGGGDGYPASSDGSDYAEERLMQLQAAVVAAASAAEQPQQAGSDGRGSGGSSGGAPTSSIGTDSSGGGSSRSSSPVRAPQLAGAGGSFSFAARPGGGEDERGATPEFGPPAPAAPAEHSPPVRIPSLPLPAAESCLILKFVSSRLLCQSEQFAFELTRHVGLCAPDSRILRQKGSSEQEWREAYEAAAALKDRFPDLYEEMTRNSCCLVMEYIPGGCVFSHPAAFAGERLQQTAEDLGRLFTVDMLLGNADRLHCRELAWRGNPQNVLYATSGRWQGRAVAIDAVVQRRPPGGLMSVEDSCCEKLTELALNEAEVAGAVLRQALQPAAEVCASWDAATLREAAAAFQRGLQAALDAAVTIKGLLEMMFDVTTDWIDSFLHDIEATGGVGSSLDSSAGAYAVGGHGHAGAGGGPVTTPRSAAGSRRVSSAGGGYVAGAASPLLLQAAASTTAQTMRIRQINHEAQRNDTVGEKVAHWKGVFREKGEELRAAVEEWQAKRGGAGQRLTTAFLDGTHPVVDVYELKVRLEHMLQRLRVLQQATLTGRPCRLMPRLYLSGAVEASSHHLLRHMGITHILNATEDLLLPDEAQGFVTYRCPLSDVEEEDLSPHLEGACTFIDTGLASGGAVLVHCHAGKSRSCSLALAWLMTRRRWPLNRAMQFLHRVRPEAAPNAGYLAALLRLEEGLFGRQTVKMKKTKPEPRCCPVCGERVGLSADSVRVHLRLKHPGSVLARGSQDGGSGNWGEMFMNLNSPSGSSPHTLSPKSGGIASSGPSGSLLPPSPAAAAKLLGVGLAGGDAAAGEGDRAQQAQQQQAQQAQQRAMRRSEELLRATTPSIATHSRSRSAAAAAALLAGQDSLDSPPSIMLAAALQAADAALQQGGLAEGDAEEFLSKAAAEMA